MIIRLQKIFLLTIAAWLLAGCEPDASGGGGTPDAGSVDFSTFIAVGDSLTAGYADGALYRDGQTNSYPAIMAQQFTKVGGGGFAQPLMPVGVTGSLTLLGGALPVSDRLMLTATGNPERPALPAPITTTQATEISVPLAGIFNNMGVPGAKSYHLGAPSYGDANGVLGGTANPYFVRFRSSAVTTVIGDAAIQVPSFFVLWIGNNDVLSYATSGGVGVQGVGMPPYGSNDITDPAVFPTIYNGIVATLKTPTNKGLLMNIPDVTTIPYFTTVPYNAIPLTADEANQLNMDPSVAGYNGGVTASIGFNGLTAEEAAARQISYQEGQNRVLILDDALTDLTGVPGTGGALINLRQATADDYIVLPASSKLGTEQVPGDLTTVWGVSNPLLDGDVLTSSEVAIVDNARNQFNATIMAAAAANADLLFFDVAALLTQLNEEGILYGSGGVTSEFATGGAFSLDGVHPTARGYAVVANEIFEVINEGFDAYIPPVNPGDYTTVFYQ